MMEERRVVDVGRGNGNIFGILLLLAARRDPKGAHGYWSSCGIPCILI